jgi:hypothetical protein
MIFRDGISKGSVYYKKLEVNQNICSRYNLYFYRSQVSGHMRAVNR